MNVFSPASTLTETQFAELVDRLATGRDQSQLIDLLREENAVYRERGAMAVVRMRGWVLLTLARGGLPDEGLIFVLEELDAGVDAYLVAAAARALRSHPEPRSAWAPFLMRALTNIRYHDELVTFDGYGEYPMSSNATSPVRELLATLAWLGPQASAVRDELAALQQPGAGLAKKFGTELEQAIRAIQVERPPVNRTDLADADCCPLPAGLANLFAIGRGSRRPVDPLETVQFEDHEGREISFGEFFSGHPAIVVFFYTRCENPLKCSLSVAKLARLQSLLQQAGQADQIRTAAITYDPEFDRPERLRGYGLNRKVQLDANHRMLRTTKGFDALCEHFSLGVNFIESLVNRHRIELYILDSAGQIAASFQRLHWEEEQVVQRAIQVLEESSAQTKFPGIAPSAGTLPRSRKAVGLIGSLASIGVAIFPKCPICWAAYMSMFGIAGLGQIPYSPWLWTLLIVVMLVNLLVVWWRGRSTGSMLAFCLSFAGAGTIVITKTVSGWEFIAYLGVLLTMAGSVLSALGPRRRKPSKFILTSPNPMASK